MRAVSAEMLTTRAIAASPALRAASAGDGARVFVIAAGKPAGAMVRGLLRAGIVPSGGMIATAHLDADALAALADGGVREDGGRDDALREGGTLADGRRNDAARGGDLRSVGALRVFLAGHPVPTAGSVAAGTYALELARTISPDDRLIVLLSGGASALFAAPADGLTLDDKMRATKALLGAGAAIHELNSVRKHLSAVKGGRLAAAARGRVSTFALSDVISPIDDDPGVIGSGPTVPDETTFADALAAIDRLGVREAMPPAVLAHLQRGLDGVATESPKPGDPLLARGTYTLIGSRRDAMAAARQEAERLGFTVLVIEEAIAGEARDAAPRLLARARALVADAQRSAATAAAASVAVAVAAARSADARAGLYCVIASGETTVRVTGSGRGGRNQEFALALAPLLDARGGAAATPVASTGSARVPAPPDGGIGNARSGVDGVPVVVAASVGTDGIDGPTDAAGAMVDPTTVERAAARGIGEPAAFLANNDAWHFFEALGDLIKTGPTDTNVGDLQIFLFVPSAVPPAA